MSTVLYRTPFDRILAALERWREGVDRDRDRVAALIATRGATPLLLVLLEELERDRGRVTALLERLRAERNEPALLFPVRPRRALKAALRTDRCAQRRHG